MQPTDDEREPRVLALSRRPMLLLTLVLGVTAVALAASLPAGRDAAVDGWSWSAGTATGLAWFPLTVIALCSGLHYVGAAAATRAASRLPLPAGETTAAQLCASTANKVTPAGLGGSAVLARFLARRTGMSTSEAVGTVGVIALARGLAAALTLGVLLALAPLMGVPGGLSMVSDMAHRVRSSAALPWVLGGVAVLAVGGAVLARRGRAGGSAMRLRDLGVPLRAVARQPRRVATLLGASAAQSLVLGTAFAAATVTLPGDRPSASLVGLVAGYLLASALAAAVPMPGGVGTGEAALTAVLVAADVPLAHAVADVLLFRVLTLWAPAVIGLPCARLLRRRGAL